MGDSRDEFAFTRDEVFVLRQSLFLAVFHRDPAFDEDVHTLTGLEAEEFPGMLRRIDRLLDGHDSGGGDGYLGVLR